jgi:hypothetical protein
MEERIVDVVNSYIIYIEDCGYYAEKQNTTKWNFTDDYHFAKKYKTKKSAYHNLLKHIGYNEQYNKKNVFIQPLIEKRIIEYNLNKMEEIEIKYEPKNIVNFTDEKLKVKVEFVNIDDDFWN